MYFKAGILSLLVVTSLAFGEGVEGSKPPNVLFVMVDDLRVELGAYGGEHVLSPNIDELAGQGTRFANAYVSVPVCGASRASLFTDMRATPDRFTNYYTWVEKDAPDATTIFEEFKNSRKKSLVLKLSAKFKNTDWNTEFEFHRNETIVLKRDILPFFEENEDYEMCGQVLNLHKELTS